MLMIILVSAALWSWSSTGWGVGVKWRWCNYWCCGRQLCTKVGSGDDIFSGQLIPSIIIVFIIVILANTSIIKSGKESCFSWRENHCGIQNGWPHAQALRCIFKRGTNTSSLKKTKLYIPPPSVTLATLTTTWCPQLSRALSTFSSTHCTAGWLQCAGELWTLHQHWPVWGLEESSEPWGVHGILQGA